MLQCIQTHKKTKSQINTLGMCMDLIIHLEAYFFEVHWDYDTHYMIHGS